MKFRSTFSFGNLAVPLALAFFGVFVDAKNLFASTSNNDMTYVGLPEDTMPGGRCMDGSMAGYYIRPGTDQSLFVIYLKGGGGCTTEDDCTARNGTKLGSSRDWPDSMKGGTLLDGNCEKNPDFCDATAVHIGYCTGDVHVGNNTETSDETWGFYFDGHANFAAIIEKLIADNGLGDATNVLLTGGSAGAIGAFLNVDWLADRLGPSVNVRVAPVAGWYTPGALQGDLPSIFTPSDYDHFVAGENGNAFYDAFINSTDIIPDRVKAKDLLNSDCLADYAPNEWWACMSLHQAYHYIKSPVFSIHTQYDSNQIFKTQGMAPENPEDSELESLKRYIEMWGNATRVSLGKILNNETKTPKDQPDGLFAASCLSHGTNQQVLIDGQSWMPILRDWFFGIGQKSQYYRLVEMCPVEEGGLELPCNEYKNCKINTKPNNPNVPIRLRKCAKKMVELGCAKSFGNKRQCFRCSRDNRSTLFNGGCTKQMVKKICVYAQNNNLA